MPDHKIVTRPKLIQPFLSYVVSLQSEIPKRHNFATLPPVGVCFQNFRG